MEINQVIMKEIQQNNNMITTAQVVALGFSRALLSKYNEKFVVKGGMLIAAIVGLDTRSTMDLDTTLCNLPLTEKNHRSS